MKANKSDPDLLQTRITRLTYTFKKKIELCATHYLKLWTDLNNRIQDIDIIKETYNKILESKRNLKGQWKNYSYLIAKVSSLVTLYSQFVESVEGDIHKSYKILQRSNEKRREGEQEDEQIFEDSSAAFLRCSAEIGWFFSGIVNKKTNNRTIMEEC